MEGEYDAFTEEVLPPPSSIEFDIPDVEPGLRREYQVMEGELDVVDRQPPDAPTHRGRDPPPRADRVEDLLGRRGSDTPSPSLSMPGVMEWTDDGAWDDAYGLDVTERFR